MTAIQKPFSLKALNTKTRAIFASIIKGIMGKRGAGRRPTEKATMLGITPTNTPNRTPRERVLIKSVALTTGPVSA